MALVRESFKLLVRLSKNISSISTRCPARGLQSATQPIINQTCKQEVRNCVKPSTNQTVLNNASKPLYNHECVRTVIRDHYRPNAWKRIHKHGLEKRLSTPQQRELMFRRFLKGRRHLAITDRFMNHTFEKKQKGKRISLFDQKKGFKSMKVKKTEHYWFDNYANDWPLHR